MYRMVAYNDYETSVLAFDYDLIDEPIEYQKPAKKSCSCGCGGCKKKKAMKLICAIVIALAIFGAYRVMKSK